MRLGRGGCRSKGVRGGMVCADSRCPCLQRRIAGRSTASPAGLGRKRWPWVGDLQYAEAILGVVGGEAIHGPAPIYSPRHATSPPVAQMVLRKQPPPCSKRLFRNTLICVGRLPLQHKLMTATLSPGVSTWTAPTWFRSFYNTFPLVVLPQDDQLEWKAHAKQLPPQSSVLWIHPSSPHAHPHHRPWLSSDPASLRTQLLFLLRHTAAQPLVAFKEWPVESSAPNGTLPALHIPSQERLLSTDEIRGWLEGTYPLEGRNKE